MALVLQWSACTAAAALLNGPCWDEDAAKKDGPVFSWITYLMQLSARVQAPLSPSICLFDFARRPAEGFFFFCK
jgi:hypothetical protein